MVTLTGVGGGKRLAVSVGCPATPSLKQFAKTRDALVIKITAALATPPPPQPSKASKKKKSSKASGGPVAPPASPGLSGSAQSAPRSRSPSPQPFAFRVTRGR
jgi:hypothetical protein